MSYRGRGGGRGGRGGSRGGQSKGATGPPSMHLPPDTYALFEPHRVLEFNEPIRDPRPCPTFSGVGTLMNNFEKEEPALPIIQDTPHR